jgi:hypothetical protein
MATVPYTMQPTTLGAAAAVVVTCPANQYLTTKKVTLTNQTGSPVAATLYKVPSGGVPSASNLLLSGLVIPANTVNGGIKELYEAENQILYAGDTLQAFAGSAGALNLNISGILQTT